MRGLRPAVRVSRARLASPSGTATLVEVVGGDRDGHLSPLERIARMGDRAPYRHQIPAGSTGGPYRRQPVSVLFRLRSTLVRGPWLGAQRLQSSIAPGLSGLANCLATSHGLRGRAWAASDQYMVHEATALTCVGLLGVRSMLRMLLSA